MQIVRRNINPSQVQALVDSGVPPIMAKLYAARAVSIPESGAYQMQDLLKPEALLGCPQMAKALADAIAQQKQIMVIGDYDADGATATAVAVKGLQTMGANINFIVPNRFEYGYGLTPEIVDLAYQQRPDILLTVDNGIASIAGVERANALGLQVLITDHHLPADETPNAACIVNPNQRGCAFPSKHLAGVGVMFYVLIALRAELKSRNALHAEINLGELLDLVALGTVADLVKLDRNNRILVAHGLKRIQQGKACLGLQAMFRVAGRDVYRALAQDLAFYIGPRLNAAGRMDDMTVGIQCLLATDMREAMRLAQELHQLNAERKQVETEMQWDAIDQLDANVIVQQYSISIYQPEWHQGVIGILASRIKERFHRPTIVFALAEDGTLKGSGRSIAGLHLRDALDLVTKRAPDIIIKFGGHAMAAGLSIHASQWPRFQQLFEEIVQSLIDEQTLAAKLETDGALETQDMTLDNAMLLDTEVWGQGFPPPVFEDQFEVVEQRPLGDQHLKLRLRKGQQEFEGVFFNVESPLSAQAHMVYQLQANYFNGSARLQLLIKHAQTTPDAI